MRKIATIASTLALAGCVITVLPATLNPQAPPAFGSATVQAGFVHTVNLTAGGPISASVVGCNGYVASPPDFSINFQTIAGILPLIFSVSSATDTTLVVNDPYGNWICDDDGGPGLNPLVRINGPVAGRYSVWVGTYNGGTAPATLRVN